MKTKEQQTLELLQRHLDDISHALQLMNNVFKDMLNHMVLIRVDTLGRLNDMESTLLDRMKQLERQVNDINKRLSNRGGDV